MGAVRGSVLMRLSTVNKPRPSWMSLKYWLSNVNWEPSFARTAMSNTFTAQAAISWVRKTRLLGAEGLSDWSLSAMFLQWPTPTCHRTSKY